MNIGTPLLWTIFAIFVVIALLIDFFAMKQQGAHRVSMKEAGLWSLVWVLVSFAFCGWLWWYLGGPADNPVADAKALEFVTGYLVEKALAVDNIFVFLMVFTYFAVPAEHQKRVLMIGILGALVLRAILILVGAWLLAQFHWLLYLFGAFLVLTGVKMWWAAGQEPDLGNNPALKWINRHLKIAPNFDGEKFFTVQNGVRMATPLLVALLFLEMSDIIFAVDSVPAIFALTKEPLIVFTSNMFAILGLRAMYFLLAGVVHRFRMLKYGLGLILVFVGLKMVWLNELYGGKFPVSWSLGIIGALLFGSIALSLIVTRGEKAGAGR
jgi:tellurite resistance protein TerC